MMTDDTVDRREAARLRSEEYRQRRRRGVMLVTVEIGRETVCGLERLGFLRAGNRDVGDVANAAAHFLTVAPSVAGMGEALFPRGVVMPSDDGA